MEYAKLIIIIIRTHCRSMIDCTKKVDQYKWKNVGCNTKREEVSKKNKEVSVHLALISEVDLK